MPRRSKRQRRRGMRTRSGGASRRGGEAAKTLFRWPYPPARSRVEITDHDRERIEDDFLNDSLIDFYFRKLQDSPEQLSADARPRAERLEGFLLLLPSACALGDIVLTTFALATAFAHCAARQRAVQHEKHAVQPKLPVFVAHVEIRARSGCRGGDIAPQPVVPMLKPIMLRRRQQRIVRC